MSISDRQRELDYLLDRVLGAEMDLFNTVVDACPGIHSTIQHRDMRPPWCPNCGRTDYGRVVHHVDQ